MNTVGSLHTRSISYLKKEIPTHVTEWMDPGDVMLSERSQTQKDTQCLIPLTGGHWGSQIHRDRKQMVGARGWGRGSPCLMGTEFQFGKMRKIWRWMVGIIANNVNVLHATELCA